MEHLRIVCVFVILSVFFRDKSLVYADLHTFVGASEICGGHFFAPTGVIRSPNYPAEYSIDTVCEWIIEAPNEHQVTLNVKKFEIEPRDCKCDYLEIRNGISAASPLIGKYCGTNIPAKITSFGNQIYLKFTTDHRGNYAGFDIEWDSTNIGCGSNSTFHNGSIFSPNYPQPYSHAIECDWKIRVSAGNVILLKIVDLQLQGDDQCEFNFVEIYDGPDTNGYKLGRYCQPNYPLYIQSTSNVASIIFHSNHSASGRGFQINYQTLCHNKFDGSRGMIESPNFPNNYPSGENCSWIIEAPIGKHPSLTFSHFNLEGRSQGPCNFDYLEITEGNDDEPNTEIGKLCGSTVLPTKIVSNQRQLFLQFHSDGSGSNSGFQLEWVSSGTDAIWDSTTERNQSEETDATLFPTTEMTQPEETVTTLGTTEMSRLEGCGGTLTTISGTILSPNYPNPYRSASECEWRIRVSAGNVILLRIVDLELEADNQCRFDYVEIIEGLDQRGRKFGRYCDRNHPIYIQTTSNVATIRFHSDSSLSGRGFYINYQTVCHNKLRGFRGVVESPNFPINYPHRSDCTWIIEAPMGNKLNLTFSHFDLEAGHGDSCLYDYLEVTEGGDDRPNRELGKFCHSTRIPPKIVSTQRQVFLQFLSDSSVSNSGFRLEWVVNGCGGLLTQPEGTITSPGYPTTDSQNIDCEWTIEVKHLQSIEITLVDVNLGKLPKCSFSKLIVYNGADETVPKLIETCHTDRLVTLTSTGNKLFVKLHIDHSDHHPRFKATYKSVDIQCGGRFTAPAGLIHSINYSPNYPPTQKCEWLIQVPVNYLVNLTFSDFDIQNSRNCSQDYVRIFDGSSRDAHLLGSHCHDTLPPSYISSSNELLIVRKTDSTQSTKGFKATYDLACGARIVTDNQGILSIDSAVGLHKQIINCSWTIVAQDPDGHVTFTLTELRVLSMQTRHDECYSSFLQVFEGERTDGLLLGTWCNTTVPLPITSQGNALTIQATSLNGTLHKTKFSGFYSVHNPACGGNYTSEHGTIATPSYSNNHPSNIECIWHLRTSPGNRLSLSFTKFDLIESEHCNLESVEVREETCDGKLIGVYCGSNINAINSPKSLWIKFKGHTERRGEGFIADYSLLHGGHLSGPSGEIASPLYPKPCMLRGEYFWRIFVDSTSSIQISFKDFHIEQSENECSVYITIYDGYDVNAPELLTTCGVTLPEAVRSTSNVVYVKFSNYALKEGSWFLLNWLQVPSTGGRSYYEILRDFYKKALA